MFQNRVLRKIFGSEKDEVTGECRRHIVRNFMVYVSVYVIRSRRMTWVGHVVCEWEEREVHIGFWWGNLRDKDHLEDLGVERIVLTWIFEK